MKNLSGYELRDDSEVKVTVAQQLIAEEVESIEREYKTHTTISHICQFRHGLNETMMT
jgi:S-adenosylmethionine synthetase